MSKRYDRKVFNDVKKGLANRTPTDAERKKDAERERLIQAEVNRIRLESERIRALLKRQADNDAAHQQAEKDRREAK